jgi:hypothetical protein
VDKVCDLCAHPFLVFSADFEGENADQHAGSQGADSGEADSYNWFLATAVGQEKRLPRYSSAAGEPRARIEPCWDGENAFYRRERRVRRGTLGFNHAMLLRATLSSLAFFSCLLRTKMNPAMSPMHRAGNVYTFQFALPSLTGQGWEWNREDPGLHEAGAAERRSAEGE